MVRPPSKQQQQQQQVPVADTCLVSFINEYLFNPHQDASSSALRHQRAPPSYKRYRSMWRSAAKSLIKKRYSSQETHLPSADQPAPLASLHKGFSSQETLCPSADHLLIELPSHVSLPNAGGLDTVDSQPHTSNGSIRIDVDAEEGAPLIIPVRPKSTLRGSNKAQPLEASSTTAITKNSSRKPPRPPRASVSRSGSQRAIRLKIASRRAMMDNSRMKKQKSPKSTSNATPIWALVITICFATIMLLQGFLGNNSEGLDSKLEGQSHSVNVSSLSPNKGMALPFTESRSQNLVAEREDGKRFDRLQHSEQRDSPFTRLRRHRVRRLQETSQLAWAIF